MATRLERLTHKARTEPQTRFNALVGQLYDLEGLRESFERQDGTLGAAAADGSWSGAGPRPSGCAH